MRHIYVHVPFCARRCSYCDFAIAVRKRIPAGRYVVAVLQELRFRHDQGEWDDEPLETLYFGGGTPSLLPPDRIAQLIAAFPTGAGNDEATEPTIRRSADPPIRPEVTLEANPDDVTPAAARTWREAGVNRVSLGAQSFHPDVLRWMHRTHDAAAVPRAVKTLRGAGIPAISLDLIFGLPEELAADFGHDLDQALALEPQHLSVYGLSVEPRTPIARWISRGATSSPTDERYATEFMRAHDTLTDAGFEHYEVSNYARPGHQSRHNSAYWSSRRYAGLGPAAHSYDPPLSPRERGTGGEVRRQGGGSGMRVGERRWNHSQWTAYDRALARGNDPTESRERLTWAQHQLESLYLGLRTSAGVERAAWWGLPAPLEQAWGSEGWLLRDGARYRLTPLGWLRMDELIAVLTTSAGGG